MGIYDLKFRCEHPQAGSRWFIKIYIWKLALGGDILSHPADPHLSATTPCHSHPWSALWLLINLHHISTLCTGFLLIFRGFINVSPSQPEQRHTTITALAIPCKGCVNFPWLPPCMGAGGWKPYLLKVMEQPAASMSALLTSQTASGFPALAPCRAKMCCDELHMATQSLLLLIIGSATQPDFTKQKLLVL